MLPGIQAHGRQCCQHSAGAAFGRIEVSLLQLQISDAKVTGQGHTYGFHWLAETEPSLLPYIRWGRQEALPLL